MLKGINYNTILIFLLTMVLSCSASRSITTSSKVVIKQQKKDTVIVLDSVPNSQLNSTEKNVKKEVNKLVASVSNKGDNSDKVLGAISQMQIMMTEMFNQSVLTRIKNDSLEWVNRQKDTALKHREKVIDELVRSSNENAKVGNVILQQIKIAGDISIRVVFYYFGAIGLVLLSIYLFKRDVKNRFNKLKQSNE